MSVQIETVKTDSFSMDYFRFGQGENTLVILPGLSVQSVMGFADSVVDAYQVLGPYASLQIAENLKNQEGVVLYMYNSYGHAAYDLAPDYKERILSFLKG